MQEPRTAKALAVKHRYKNKAAAGKDNGGKYMKRYVHPFSFVKVGDGDGDVGDQTAGLFDSGQIDPASSEPAVSRGYSHS
ncbi:hypothetical protein [Nitrosovibrio tenuis]|uniref:hypothetical protein n=1 Tax=Nitrosovibrio tenuis TaxID=1233 RepID=UPI0015A69BE2|nr:hypothetical protein [Nitrosovibrio tenuis]